MQEEKNQDFPEIVYGATQIARIILCKADPDETEVKRIYYWLERGFVDGADKMGGIWRLSVLKFRKSVHGAAAL